MNFNFAVEIGIESNNILDVKGSFLILAYTFFPVYFPGNIDDDAS